MGEAQNFPDDLCENSKQKSAGQGQDPLMLQILQE